jgi:stage II sporulation protein R
MQVRDAVLEATQDGILECTNAKDARAYIEKNLEIIEKTANETLAENGFDYTATAQVGTFHFPEKTYQNMTYPEGDYQALRVTLGKGDGHNWWCVMFPPLCLTEIDGIDEDATQVEYTSFFAELFENLFG